MSRSTMAVDQHPNEGIANITCPLFYLLYSIGSRYKLKHGTSTKSTCGRDVPIHRLPFALMSSKRLKTPGRAPRGSRHGRACPAVTRHGVTDQTRMSDRDERDDIDPSRRRWRRADAVREGRDGVQAPYGAGPRHSLR